jgi:hypothetical protein
MHSGNFLAAIILAGTTALLGGCIVAPVGPPAYSEVITVAPPKPRFEYRPQPPASDHLWINGYWNWNGDNYRWVSGYWQAPRPGHVWEPHRWEQEGQHWRQRGGQWRKHDERQPQYEDRQERRRDYRDHRDEGWNRR